VGKSVPQNVCDVFVGEAVEHHPAFAPSLDEASRPKRAKLMTHRRLARINQHRQVTDAQLVCLGERMENLETGRVAHDGEEFGTS
jgi:hypothetical protein